MKNLFFASIIFFVFQGCSGCSKPHDSTAPQVVHVFRDRDVIEIESAIRQLGGSDLMTSDKRPIVIATQEPRTYKEGLATLGTETHPELIVLNSPDDAPFDQRKMLVVIKSAQREYFAAVPTWTRPEEKVAANLVLSALRKFLEAAPHQP